MSAQRKFLSSASPKTLGIAAAAMGAGVLLYNNGLPKPKLPPPYHFQPTQPTQPQKSLGSKPTFPGFGFTELTLESSRMINHNTKELRFSLPGDSDSTSGLKPISSLLTKHTAPGSWIPTFRPYTPISTSDSTHITLLVKHYPNGRASTHLHNLQPGDKLSAKALPEYDYHPNTHKQILLVAGGAGITPLYQFLQTSLRNPVDTTRLNLVYANATEGDILLKPELDALAVKYADRFSTTYITAKAAGDAKVKSGYVTKEILEMELRGVKREEVGVLVCGPPGMVDAVAGGKGGWGWTQGSVGGLLKELGFGKDQVHKF